MGTKLAVGSVKTLYDYWGETITDKLKADLTAQLSDDKAKKSTLEPAVKMPKIKRKKVEEEAHGEESVTTGAGAGAEVQLVVNLASQEYFKSVRTKSLSQCGVRVVECVFKDKGRVTSVYAKRARGLMARYIVTHGIQGPGSSGGNAESAEESFQRCLQQLRGFDLEGYSFQEAQSSDKVIVFNRTCGPPAALALEDEGEGEGEEAGEGEGKGKKVVKLKSASVSKKGGKKEEIKEELRVELSVGNAVKVEDTASKAGRKTKKSSSLPAAIGSEIDTAVLSGRLTVPEQEPVSVSVSVSPPPAKRIRVARKL
jgi:cytoplasmic iron level regulating protein YaaA (DUF328/UPF0246 family)